MSLRKLSESMRASHILVESREQAVELLRELGDGASFEVLARENSCCPSAKTGGDLGFFTFGQMSDEFEAAVVAIGPGEITGPVWTEFGHHIIKRVE